MKRCLMTILICMICCTSFVGCGGNKVESSDKLDEEQVHPVTDNANEKGANTPSKEDSFESQSQLINWEGAYSEVLGEMMDSFPNYQYLCSYSVYDVDNNGVPELLVKVGTCEADFEYRLFNYDPQLAVAMCFHTTSGGHTYPCGLDDSGAVLFVGGHQGHETIIKATYDGVSCTEDLLFNAEVQEYHDFTYLDCFELDDNTGLQWTANPPDDNASILSELSSAPTTDGASASLGDVSIEILSVDYTGDPMYPLNVTYRINDVPTVRGCVYLSCDAHAYSTQMFFFDENHVNEYRPDGIYDYQVGWSGEGMTNYFNIYYGYGSFDPYVGWSNSSALKMYYRLVDDYGTISSETIPKDEIIPIYDGDQEIGAWTLHESGDLIEAGGNSTAAPFAKNTRFTSSTGHVVTVSSIDGVPRFSVDGVEIGSPRTDPIEMGTGALFYEIDAANGTYTISRFPNDEYITVNVMGNMPSDIAGDYFPE